jgi:hypothetical protein
MKFMIIVKATPDTEAGVLPKASEIEAMGKFNEEMIQAGVMLDGMGLQASSKGAKVLFRGDQRVVVDGPFTETKELIAGFWLIQVKSKEEAIAWAKRSPHPHFNKSDTELEIRQVFEPTDFPEAPPELVKQEQEFRAARDGKK